MSVTSGVRTEAKFGKVRKGNYSAAAAAGPDAGKDWGREEKGVTEDEIVGWHHRLNGHEAEQAPGDGEGQWSLVCCSPRGRKELDTTERLNLHSSSILSRMCSQGDSSVSHHDPDLSTKHQEGSISASARWQAANDNQQTPVNLT